MNISCSLDALVDLHVHVCITKRTTQQPCEACAKMELSVGVTVLVLYSCALCFVFWHNVAYENC